MSGISFDEDAYWERRREELENPALFHRQSLWDESERVEQEEANLFLDEEVDEIEKQYKCPMNELSESELMDIVERHKKIDPVMAEWDSRFECIVYRYVPVGVL